MDIEAPGTHLAEPGRLDAVLVRGPPGHRVQPDVGRLLALEDPGVGAVIPRHDLRRAVLALLRDMAVEHVRGLDDMVVNGHEDEVVDVHWFLPGQAIPSRSQMPATSSKIEDGTVKGSVAEISPTCDATSSAVGLLPGSASQPSPRPTKTRA